MNTQLLDNTLPVSITHEDVSLKSNYADFAKPLPAKLMHMLRLDKVYQRASGNCLFYQGDEGPVKVIDFACGFGALILGHNHPEIVEKAVSLLQDEIPIHAQMSIRSQTGLLASALSDEIHKKTGKHYISTLANSGTEVVEAAIKHARMVFYKKLDDFYHQCEISFSNMHIALHKAGIDTNKAIRLQGKQYPSLAALKSEILKKK
ncbi:hypothetical protein AB835_06765 [Candidatus Endobugula sertula]|uniref:Aminotransferase class III n=1 Tax=Candidatus Endobugula sertula TaxID=62101 RepID=A0A1D2QQM4_9GAMM|nr:hypothetical protein AB835_06765 [Candidatus Endobugula sertula]